MRRAWGGALAGLITTVIPLGLRAHSITVDGDPSDWTTRQANHDNLGLVARTPSGAGEYVWRDAPGDHRTDLPGDQRLDILRFRATGDANNLYLLVTFNDTTPPSYTPQVQVAIDTDQVSGSGQVFLTGFADTSTSEDARWERLVQTRFSDPTPGPGARVIDTGFTEIAEVPAVLVWANGALEIGVPWSVLGLTGPPAGRLRFTVATFVSANSNDDTLDLGGTSNAFDVVTDYANPQPVPTPPATYPNTFSEVSDQVIDYSPDVWFTSAGEVRAPVVITHFVYEVVGTEPNAEWYAVRNVSGQAIALDEYKLGDEETPDAGEGMRRFPASTSLAAGATFIVANQATGYTARYGEAPDAETQSSDATVPDMPAFGAWAGGTINLAAASDEILLLDRWNTAVDVVIYLTGVYPGVTAFPTAGASDDERVIMRVDANVDTDDCSVDFAPRGRACANDAACASAICGPCLINTCTPVAAGISCADGTVCNGAELCDGAGACAPGTPLDCDDTNPCTTDGCDATAGCQNPIVAEGTPCLDGDVCNGDEACDALGVCLAGTPLTCNDGNVCTGDTCDAVLGCQFPPLAAGAACPDGDACNGAETCDGSGACEPATPLSCNDANACTTDSCDTLLGCLNPPLPAGTACGDGDACNGTESCDGAGGCAAGTPLDCSDGNACTGDTCDPVIGCQYAFLSAGTECPDGDVCNGAETCDGAGACTPGAPLSCSDGNACTVDSCDTALGCRSLPAAAGTPCADADVCDGAEACDGAGACAAGTPLSCDDANACTNDSCDATLGCANDPVAAGTSCDDGNSCNGDETCDASGICQAGTPLDCDDGDPCTTDRCSPIIGCFVTIAPADTPCDDGDPCTEDDACNGAGVCAGGTRLDGGTCDTDAGVPDAAPPDADLVDAAPPDAPGVDATEEQPDAATQPPGDEGGCGCRAAGSSSAPGAGLAFGSLMALALFLLRRRR